MGVSLKALTLILLTGLLASSMVLVESASAQTTIQLSTPTFTVQYVDGIAVLKIKNQPFTPYTSDYWNDEVSLYYNYRTKPLGATEWFENVSIGAWHKDRGAIYVRDALVKQSSSDYTTITLAVTSATTDYQVQALIGYYYEYFPNNILPTPHWPAFKDLNSSSWSTTQTLTVDKIKTTPSPTTTPNIQPTAIPTYSPSTTATPIQTKTPTQPVIGTIAFPSLNWEQTAIILLIIAVIALTVGLLNLYKRIPKTNLLGED